MQNFFGAVWGWVEKVWRAGWWNKTWMIFILAILVLLVAAYGIASWYRLSEKPQVAGVSFTPAYAEYLGVNPKAELRDLLAIGVRRFRLVGYWDKIEPSRGQYDFAQLDWQFKMIEQKGGTISLSIGLRQPRWPECHPPTWVDVAKPYQKWLPELKQFMGQVINRYKSSPALASYQLENEYFLKAFGECTDFSRDRLVDEFNFVKKLDPSHQIIVSRSNNGVGIPLGQPRPDVSAISLYRRVWNTNIYTGYFNHIEPAWYYAFLAGVTKIMTGRDTIIHELQAEPWPPDSRPIPETTLTVQSQSFNAERFRATIKYGKATGMPEVYYWGASYWYYRWKILGDKSVWNVAAEEFSSH
jgi:hypothetical protein